MLEFQVADPDVLRQRLTDAGLTASPSTRATRNGSPSGPDCSYGVPRQPIPGMLVADLTDAQRADIIRVLYGMIHERSGGSGRAVLTAPLNIGVGIK